MKEISITFSKNELETLIQTVFVGEYILESDEKANNNKGYVLLQKILKTAKESSMIKNIEHAKFDGELLIPFSMEEEMIKKIDEYNEDIFIDSLVEELVQNEMKNKYAPRLLANMNEDAYEKVSKDIVEKYLKEFELNGYKNLCIKEKTSI